MARRGSFEKQLLQEGKQPIGVDEVGRGCLAGPVFAGCVSLNYAAFKKLPSKNRTLVRDSKTLTQKQRQEVIAVLPQVANDICIGVSTVREIERLGIVEATFLAMRRALNKVVHRYDVLLVDGNQYVTGYFGEQFAIVDGDAFCFSIAAASIVAKESRDDFMREQSRHYPNYGFDSHVGYGTKMHLERIREHGICNLHRKNFAPIANALSNVDVEILEDLPSLLLETI